jgi:uncharacterized protein (TIGR02680 family)
MTLPRPQRERWQPLRSGLVNLYRYDAEEFRFHDGHLLLRGNNGSGKSRVLALQLPFLLDGEIAPQRLEPDGDPAKRIEWNLLMNRYPERLGYTWLEFGRLEAGEPRYCTLGCGLRAVAGRGLIARWFFVTERRVGEGLFLQSPAGHALTRAELEAALGGRGQIYERAADHRDAVDRALFRLGRHRYEAMVNLLIQLRQPQLSRQLDERKLSAALSEALPPVAPGVVSDVAEALRSLENDRLELEAFAAASGAVELFLRDYCVYVSIAARRRAEGVRRTHSQYEGTQRKLRAAEAERAAASAEREEVVAEQRRLEDEERAAEAARDLLAERPEMQDAAALARLREQAAARARDATRAAADEERATRRAGELADAAAAARQEAETAREKFHDTAARTGAAAERAGLERLHRGVLPAAGEAFDRAGLNAALARGREGVEARLAGVAHLRRMGRALEAAEQAVSVARQRQEDRRADLERAHEGLDAAAARLASEQELLLAAWQRWVADLQVLVIEAPDELGEALAGWAEASEGGSPIGPAVQAALGRALAALADDRAALRQRQEALRGEREALVAEREALASGQHAPPPAPHVRDAAGRLDRPGAPLWRLCDFAADVAPAARAGYEAALEASGLLDAWVLPDGAVIDPHTHDTLLAAAAPGAADASGGPGLPGAVLVPAVDMTDARAAQVSEATVARVLARIGTEGDAGPVWVAPDGRWQLGPLRGAWHKPQAEHIGHGAREAARRARLAAIERALVAIDAGLAEVAAALDAVALRQQRAQAEGASAPSEEGVLRAAHALAEAGRQLERQRERLAEADRRFEEARRAALGLREERDQVARDLGMERWVADLGGLEQALGEYQRLLAEAGAAASELLLRVEHAQRAARAHTDAAEEQAVRAEAATGARRAAEAARAECEALEQAVGAAVAEVLAQLERAKAAVIRSRDAARKARERWSELDAGLRVAEAQLVRLGEDLAAATQARDQAVSALASFVATRLLGVACAELAEVTAEGWSMNRAVELARRIESLLAEVAAEDERWERSQKNVHRQFQALSAALLPHGYQPGGSFEHEVFVVSALFRGRSCTAGELAQALQGEVTSRQTLLDAREREVLENHLIGEVSLHLHERLRAAEQLVAEMNQELAARPMSTGMTLRFRWEPLGDELPDLAAARARLLRATGTWSLEDRQILGEFLQQCIRRARSEDEGGSWQEHLALAFDYRRWHEFFVERQQEAGQWKRLTRRTHGTGSGGEKAVALTVPQFAAAAAHYRTADRHAPRLILLDEAFVGVDSDMRSKCMGLLQVFDLDFVMTSEREWGCYPTLHGLAIAQLAARAGVDAVGVTRWLWNGRERVRDVSALPPAQAPTAAPASGQGTLLDWTAAPGEGA